MPTGPDESYTHKYTLYTSTQHFCYVTRNISKSLHIYDYLVTVKHSEWTVKQTN